MKAEGLMGQFKRLGSHSVVYGLSNVLSASMMFLLLPILTRYLSPSQYGLLEVLSVMALQVSVVFQLGLGAAVVKAAVYDANEVDDRAILLSTALYTITALGLAFVGTLSIFRGSIAHQLLGSSEHQLLVVLALVRAFLDSISVIPMAWLRLREFSRLYAGVNVCRIALSLGLIWYVLTVRDGGLTEIMIASVLEAGIFAVVAVALMAGELRLRFAITQLRKMLGFGLPLIPMAFALTVLSAGDRYVLRHYTSLDSVGQYAFGYKVGAAIGLFVRAFQIAWPTVLFSVAKDEDPHRFYSRLLTYLVCILLAVWLGLSVFAKEIVELVGGPGFHSAWQVVPLVAMGQIFLAVYYSTAVGTHLTGKTGYQTLAVCLAAAANMGLNLILIPSFGAMGAAVATVVGYAIMAAVSCGLALRLYPIAYEWGRVVKVSAAALCLYVISLPLRVDTVVLDFGLKLLITFSLPALLYAGGFFSVGERTRIKALAMYSWRRGSDAGFPWPRARKQS